MKNTDVHNDFITLKVNNGRKHKNRVAVPRKKRKAIRMCDVKKEANNGN